MTYPPADTKTQWFGDRLGGTRMPQIEKVVWHMTEGADWPPYDGGRKAPHYTAKANPTLRRLVWRAHFPDDINSRAMRNEPGGVQTNIDGCLQVELVGTCNQTRTWPASMLRSWDLPDWAVADLARFAAWCHSEHGVPLRAPGLWLAYGKDPRAPGRIPASYGASPARLTPSAWDAFRGHVGHQHAPENDHGDPGAFPIAAILARAEQLLAPTPTDTLEDDMPRLDDVIDLGRGQAAVLGEPDNKVTVEQATAIQTAALVQIQREQAAMRASIDALVAELRAARGA